MINPSYLHIQKYPKRLIRIITKVQSELHHLTIEPFLGKINDQLREAATVTFVSESSTDIPTPSRSIYGILGLIKVSEENFLAVVTGIEQVGTFLNHSIYRITMVEFISLTLSKYDSLFENPIPSSSGKLSNTIEALMGSAGSNDEGVPQHPCYPLTKYLSLGSFYFSPTMDLTRDAKRWLTLGSTSIWGDFDDRFFWNRHMIKQLIKFRELLNQTQKEQLDKCGLFILAIQGFVQLSVINNSMTVGVISRLDCKKAGTRYNARGINDDGNVSNFVETELIIVVEDFVFSFLMCRGSVPVFWEQQGLQMGQPKIQLTRSTAAAQPSFNRHVEDLITRYGSIHIIDLLSQKDGHVEELLSSTYKTLFDGCSVKNDIERTVFDFNHLTKGSNYEKVSALITLLDDSIKKFNYSLIDINNNSVLMNQQGIFRINCLDCLDRTNVIQTSIAKKVADEYLSLTGRNLHLGDNPLFSDIWADNGDELSRIYTGTGALKSGFTRTGKRTIIGLMDDAKKTAQRFYVNNFQDKSRQQSIDILLGQGHEDSMVFVCNPVLESVTSEMRKRFNEYSTSKDIIVHVASWNVNGKIPYSSMESLHNWLSFGTAKADIVVVGFQEIVELTPAQIMMTDPEKRLIWERYIEECLNAKESIYALVTYGQLVGASMTIFAKKELVPHIRNVQVSIKKTGLKGIAGNKGAVAASMDVQDTNVCFVCSHLAAGNSNYDERNRDYETILYGIAFKKGRRIRDHETVIWFGDFNYRIELDNQIVRPCIERYDLRTLLESDQLIREMRLGHAFKDFKEGPIEFAPTYRYNNGTDTYDTSEKMRVPAWTDRVLYQGNNIKLLKYGREELKLSDHKPVKATFSITITRIDKEKQSNLQQSLIKRYSGTTDYNLIDIDSAPDTIAPTDLLLNTLADSVPNSLPPPSSDLLKWWDMEEILPPIEPLTNSKKNEDLFQFDPFA